MPRRKTTVSAPETKDGMHSTAKARIMEAVIVSAVTAMFVGSSEPWWLRWLKLDYERPEPNLEHYCGMKYGPGFHLHVGNMAQNWVCIGPDNAQMQ